MQVTIKSIQEDRHGFKMHLDYGPSSRLALSPTNQPTKQEKKKNNKKATQLKKNQRKEERITEGFMLRTESVKGQEEAGVSISKVNRNLGERQ